MKISTTEPLFQALKLAQERGLLPTALSSAELQEMTLRMKERVFFAARWTNLQALDEVKKLVERHVQGEGMNNDLAKLRIEARQILAKHGYDPESGFPGDVELGVPPATAGSLRDLSSGKRLNLIFETQAALARGLGMKLRNLQRQQVFPAIELVRLKDARQIDWQRDWLARWKIAADNVDWVGVSKEAFAQGRMIALQTSPIWPALGSSALFADALNVDYPPFAFNSGMGWRFVGFRESATWGLNQEEIPAAAAADPATAVRTYAKTLGSALSDTLKNGIRKAPTTSAPDPERLQRLLKLREKFNAITAKRGY